MLIDWMSGNAAAKHQHALRRLSCGGHFVARRASTWVMLLHAVLVWHDCGGRTVAYVYGGNTCASSVLLVVVVCPTYCVMLPPYRALQTRQQESRVQSQELREKRRQYLDEERQRKEAEAGKR